MTKQYILKNQSLKLLLLSCYLLFSSASHADTLLEPKISTTNNISSETSTLLPNLTLEMALKSATSMTESLEKSTAQVPLATSTTESSWLPPVQRALAAHLIDTYDVAPSLANNVIASVFHSGRFYNIDPLLLLAVMKVESTFNPRAVSSAKAKGLMQVLPKAHPEKIALLGGVEQLYIPHLNVRLGAQILRECVDRAGGVIARGLQFYNGSGNDPKQRYANKVMTAHQEFNQIKIALATENTQFK